MLKDESLDKLRVVYTELLKITGVTGSEPDSDYRDRRLLEHIHLYFKRIDKNPIYKNKKFKG